MQPSKTSFKGWSKCILLTFDKLVAALITPSQVCVPTDRVQVDPPIFVPVHILMDYFFYTAVFQALLRQM